MPQGQKEKSAVEVFEHKQRKPSAVDVFERRQPDEGRGVSGRSMGLIPEEGMRFDLSGGAPSVGASGKPQGVVESFQQGLAGRLINNVIETGADLWNAPLETLERAGRAGLEFAAGFDPMGNAYEPTVQGQAARVAELNRLADERLPETVRMMKLGQAVQEARPRSRAASVALGVGSVVGDIAFPTAPESAIPNLVMAPAGGVAARGLSRTVVAPLLRRIRGRGNAVAVFEEGAAPSVSRASVPARPEPGLPSLEADMGASAPTISARPSASASASMRGPAAESSNFSLAADDMAAIGKAGEELVAKAERSSVLDIITAARRAGLLSSVKTHLRNVAGTGAFQLSEEAARIPGAIIDMIVGRVTGRRTLTGPSLGSMQRSFQEAATKGLAEAKEIWRKGITQTDLERLGLNTEIDSGSRVLDYFINKTFRLLSAEDKLLYTYAARRALESRARALALTEIRQGKLARGDFGKRFNEILADVPEDMGAAAAADAEMAVFTNDNVVSKFLAGGRKEAEKLPGGRGATFFVDLIFPFTKTPTNIVARMLDYAGVGATTETTKAIARRIVGKSMTPAQQHAFSQAWGRFGIGGGLIALGAIGYRDGWLTGFIEDEPGRRARDEAAGRTPGSILVNGNWLQITGFAPLASLLAVGATLQREVDQEREEASGLLPALEVGASAIGQQPLLIGAQQIGESLTKPGTTGERLLGGLVGSFVPSFISDIAEAVDQKQREARGITGYARKRLPFLRSGLPESRDVLGNARQDFGPTQAMLDPTRAMDDAGRQNPILREFVKLDTGISKMARKDGESAGAYEARRLAFGTGLYTWGLMLLDSAQYAQASNADKRRALLALVKDVRRSLERKGEEWRLRPAQIFETLREADERKRERERGRR